MTSPYLPREAEIMERVQESPSIFTLRLRITDQQAHAAGNGQMVAFLAKDRATVDQAHAVALANGGRSEGAPGPRPEYHASYYGAFVLDPDGNNVEAVCHAPEHSIG